MRRTAAENCQPTQSVQRDQVHVESLQTEAFPRGRGAQAAAPERAGEEGANEEEEEETDSEGGVSAVIRYHALGLVFTLVP